ncbi:MAG: amidohydrolase [Firmicutes bacterium]|nr:amidohydrolase [Bacillota bacterium]
MDYSRIFKVIDDNKEEFNEMAKKMYENPELAYNEVKACGWLVESLKKHGFDVEVGLYGMPTAIRATWGKGHPIIGVLAEYDALPGLSQSQNVAFDPVVVGAPGQGCGHNMLGVATLAGAIAMKDDLEQNGLEGTVVFYGCPAEEVLTGKTFMARGGAFKELDLAIAYHPGNNTSTSIGVMTGLNSAIFHFKGKTAHAGGAPWLGRSALDAAEIMSVGANYLREHIEDGIRIHYSYKEAGTAPNIVPDRASVWYYVRAFTRDAVEDTYKRLVKCAEGAAHMTETELEVEFLGGCYDTMPNKVVANTLYETMLEMPPIPFDDEDRKFADGLNHNSHLFNGTEVAPLIETVQPIRNEKGSGSTDVGDVMHIVPCAMFNTTTNNSLCGGHTWMITACSGNPMGWKGMIQGAKIMAATAAKFYRDPALVKAAQEEFKEAMAGKSYKCPIPMEVPVPQPQK